MGNTLTDLPNDLQKIIESPLYTDRQKRTAEGLQIEAESGEYHGFSSSWPSPKTQLHSDLAEAGFTDLARKVTNGDYDDESPDDNV